MMREYSEHNLTLLVAGLSRYIMTDCEHSEREQLTLRFMGGLALLGNGFNEKAWSQLMGVWAEVPHVRIGTAKHPATGPRVFTRANESVSIFAAGGDGAYGADRLFVRDADDNPYSTLKLADTQAEAEALIYAIKAIMIHLPSGE